MKIKIKNADLNLEAIHSINNLIELEISGTSAFKLSRIIKHISSIVEDKSLAEKKIFEKWVERDEFGKFIIPKNENGEVIEGAFKLTDPMKFSEEMSELMNLENELPFEKLKFNELGIESLKTKDLMKIDFLFE